MPKSECLNSTGNTVWKPDPICASLRSRAGLARRPEDTLYRQRAEQAFDPTGRSPVDLRIGH
jgi:hypothetical protein